MNCLFLLLLLCCCGNNGNGCHNNCENHCDDHCDNHRDNCCDDICDNRQENCCDNCGCDNEYEWGQRCERERDNSCECGMHFSVNTQPGRPYAEDNRRRRDDNCGCNDNRREPRIFPPVSGETCGCEE